MTQVQKEEAAVPGATSSPATVYRSDYAVQPVTPSVLFNQPVPIASFLRTRLGRIAALSTGAALALGALLGTFGLAPLFARAAKESAPMVATRVELLPPPSCLRN